MDSAESSSKPQEPPSPHAAAASDMAAASSPPTPGEVEGPRVRKVPPPIGVATKTSSNGSSTQTPRRQSPFQSTAEMRRSYSMDDTALPSRLNANQAEPTGYPLLSLVTRALIMLACIGFVGRNIDFVGASSHHLTYYEISNMTFAKNPFFSEGTVFTAEAIANLSRIFVGIHYSPDEMLRQRDTISDFFMIENGSAIAMPIEDESDDVPYRNYQRRGDTVGGLNMLYGRPSLHAVKASDEGVFVWKASSEQLRELLADNMILAAVMERKFLQTFIEKRDKKPLLLFPGFASTQLIAWKHKQCAGIGSIKIGDRVWLNIEQVLHHNFFEELCWLRCMALDIVDQKDPIDCKLRPEEGLAAINSLIDGILSPFTTIFGTLVQDMAQNFGYDSSSVLAVPYDWRLAPRKLQERDALFSKIQMAIEHIVTLNKNPGITLCHSMGCNVYLYFVKWIEHKMGDKSQEWIDKHLWMSVMVAAPLLGSSEAVKGVLSGMTFGLPLEPADARVMGATFSSGHWLLPQNCPAHVVDEERIERPSMWHDPHVVTIEYDGSRPPSHYTHADVIQGKMYKDLAQELNDPEYDKFYRALHKYYHNDTIYNALDGQGPPRPPVRKVLALYGTNVATDVSYRYRITRDEGGVPRLVLVSEVRENPDRILRMRDATGLLGTSSAVGESPYTKAGDGTVPYASLSWANTWHFDNLTVVDTPASYRLDVDQMLGQLLGTSVPFSSSVVQSMLTLEPAYTKYESSGERNGRSSHVTVIEMDSVTHRDVIRDVFMVKMFKDEYLWQLRKEFLAERRPGPGPSDGQGPMEGLWGLLSRFAGHSQDASPDQLMAELQDD